MKYIYALLVILFMFYFYKSQYSNFSGKVNENFNSSIDPSNNKLQKLAKIAHNIQNKFSK